MAAIAGILYLKVDGRQYSLRGSVNISPHSRTNTPVTGQDGFHGHIEREVAPTIEAEISDRGDLSIMALQSITAATITAELVNGKTYILNEACFEGPAVLNGTEGNLTVKFFGSRCIELMS